MRIPLSFQAVLLTLVALSGLFGCGSDSEQPGPTPERQSSASIPPLADPSEIVVNYQTPHTKRALEALNAQLEAWESDDYASPVLSFGLYREYDGPGDNPR